MPEATNAAIDALKLFLSKYLPCTIDDADEFFTSTQIREAIASHTGITLGIEEMFSVMEDLKFNYEIYGLEYTWLLKRKQ